METIAEFNDNHGFNVRLTTEKIFIDAAGSSETIALRGLNGVGLYDDIEKYNQELEQMKNGATQLKVILAITFVVGLWVGINLESFIFIFIGVLAGGFLLLRWNAMTGEPVLDSYFRLMLSGGDRKFKFNKSNESSVQIADFINKVEDTLTAYR